MTRLQSLMRLTPAALLLACAGLAQAQSAPGDARERYAQERQTCQTANYQDSTATCMREAGAALQEARAGNLTSPDQNSLQRNALQRCAAFNTAEERADCERRVGNQAASGSVLGGGVLRESQRTIVLPPQ